MEGEGLKQQKYLSYIHKNLLYNLSICTKYTVFMKL